MNQLIALLLPSIIGLKQCDNFFGTAKDIKTILERYLLCVLFINMISYAIVIYIFKLPFFIFTNQFTLKYIILSVVLEYVLPIIYKFITYNIKMNIKVKNGKHNKN